MVHAKNRLFNSLILTWRHNANGIEFGAAICGLGVLMIILIVVLIYECLKSLCCPRASCRKQSRNTTKTKENQPAPTDEIINDEDIP